MELFISNTYLGPAIYFDEYYQKNILAAITSMSIGGLGQCVGGVQNFPSIYARVSTQIDWIHQIVKDDLCKV